MTNPKVSIVIVNYNTGELLKNCLDSISSNLSYSSYEIIVVDNNSADGSREMLSVYPGIKPIFNGQNLGFGRANNRGIKIARGDYVLLLNSDTIVLPKSIDQVVNYLDNNPSVGVLGPRLVGKDRKIKQMSWVFLPSFFWEFVQKIFSPKNIKLSLVRVIVDLIQRKEREVPSVAGASMFIRRKVFEEAGFLDENLFLYFEEPDFCLRVKKKGWKVVFYPAAEIIHLLGETMVKTGGITQLYYRQSQIYYYKKHHSLFEQWLLKQYLLLKFKILLFARNSDGEIERKIVETIRKW
ncbi:MAG: glycosyltransferase family 2 protein [Elusimicrobiota bacterium]